MLKKKQTMARPRSRVGRGSAKARKKAARLAAVQALYQMEQTCIAPEAVINEFLKHRIGRDLERREIDGVTFVEPDADLFTAIVRLAGQRLSEIDLLISNALTHRTPLERLELLLRAILRAGVAELLAHRDVHARILLSEYIDIAHAFFSGREPNMVNGVLDRIARSLRPIEANNPLHSSDETAKPSE
ncbi:transcription antitermination protein NusB [Azospirillaceae bacterium]